MRAALLTLLLTFPLLAGCPKTGDSSTSGDAAAEPKAFVVFEVFEAGSGNALSATVWPREMPDHFETIVQGEAGSAVKFAGLGRTEGGYALPFEPGKWVGLLLGSPGHELKSVELKVRKGDNLLTVELKRTEVDDEKVPERIRLEVLESLPSEGPKSGS